MSSSDDDSTSRKRKSRKEACAQSRDLRKKKKESHLLSSSLKRQELLDSLSQSERKSLITSVEDLKSMIVLLRKEEGHDAVFNMYSLNDPKLKKLESQRSRRAARCFEEFIAVFDDCVWNSLMSGPCELSLVGVVSAKFLDIEKERMRRNSVKKATMFPRLRLGPLPNWMTAKWCGLETLFPCRLAGSPMPACDSPLPPSFVLSTLESLFDDLEAVPEFMLFDLN